MKWFGTGWIEDHGVISGLESGEQVIVSDMTKYKGKEKLKVD